MFLTPIETPIAFVPLGTALLTLIWKTYGLRFFPGYEEVFDKGDAQYPVREVNLELWNGIYFVMYGILGTLAQFNGLRISLDKPNRKPKVNPITKRRAQILGFFHCVIGTHHMLWAFAGSGRLDLTRFDLPEGFQAMSGVVGVWTGLHGLRLLLVKTGDNFDKVVRHKVVCDVITTLTLTPLLVFIPANWVGYRDFSLERNIWIVTFTAPLLVLIGDLLTAKV